MGRETGRERGQRRRESNRDRVRWCLPGHLRVVDSDVVGGGAVTFNFCDWWGILQRNDGRVGAVTQVLWLLLCVHTHTKRYITNSENLQ